MPEAIRRDPNKRQAFRLGFLDAERTEITEAELCAFTWNVSQFSEGKGMAVHGALHGWIVVLKRPR